MAAVPAPAVVFRESAKRGSLSGAELAVTVQDRVERNAGQVGERAGWWTSELYFEVT